MTGHCFTACSTHACLINGEAVSVHVLSLASFCRYKATIKQVNADLQVCWSRLGTLTCTHTSHSPSVKHPHICSTQPVG